MQTNAGPNWQWPQWPIAHFMLRSSERWIRSADPAVAQARATAKRIITSGPQTSAVVRGPSKLASGISVVTSPTRPFQPLGALSTVVADLDAASPHPSSCSG